MCHGFWSLGTWCLVIWLLETSKYRWYFTMQTLISSSENKWRQETQNSGPQYRHSSRTDMGAPAWRLRNSSPEPAGGSKRRPRLTNSVWRNKSLSSASTVPKIETSMRTWNGTLDCATQKHLETGQKPVWWNDGEEGRIRVMSPDYRKCKSWVKLSLRNLTLDNHWKMGSRVVSFFFFLFFF